MTALRKTIGTTWTELVDWTGKYVKQATVSRESEQELHLVYGPPVPTESTPPEWIVSQSFIGIRTSHLPSGGRLYARLAQEPEEVVLNYD